MKAHRLLIAGLALTSLFPSAYAKGKAEHVVVVVWDGLRPDSINPQHTPALYELAVKGTFFKNHHSAYVSSTEVNGTALATGLHPDHSGILANRAYSPDASWTASYATESLDYVRRADVLTQGNYLRGATVAELLHRAGIPTVIAGSKPIALLHDRAAKKVSQAEKDSVTLFRGMSLPRSVTENFAKSPDIGPFPAPPAPRLGGTGRSTNETESAFPVVPTSAGTEGTNSSGFGGGAGRRAGGAGGFGGLGGPAASTPDMWTTRALTRGLWRKSVPKYSLLWLSEPDAAQHATGPGSEASLAALESSDKNLATVLKALEDRGVADSTDVLVVSDHGFSTVSRGFDLVEILKKAKFNAATQFENPEAGDVLVINLGGTAFFYVFEHDETVTRKLAAYLQGTEFAGVIFSSLDVEGTFPLSLVHLAGTNSAPDVAVSMRWSPDRSETGAPGMMVSPDGKKGLGIHGSLSRFDLHNTLIAAGPDFKKGFVSSLPSGNIDVVPTVLTILGVEPSAPLDGRPLAEAMVNGPGAELKAVEKRHEVSKDIGFLVWRQYLKVSQVGHAVYYDEGNGEAKIK